MFFKKSIVLIFILLWLTPWVYAEEGRWAEPWGNETSRRDAKEEIRGQRLSSGQQLTGAFFRLFQEYISPVDGDRCPSYPTCSQYGLEAVRKHGVLMGLVMSFDRLIHESDEIRRAPLIRVHDSYRYYDPVENNDFWWSKK